MTSFIIFLKDSHDRALGHDIYLGHKLDSALQLKGPNRADCSRLSIITVDLTGSRPNGPYRNLLDHQKL